jgi:hypothetical protein
MPQGIQKNLPQSQIINEIEQLQTFPTTYIPIFQTDLYCNKPFKTFLKKFQY